MWQRRVLPFVVFLGIQLLFLAHVLNSIETDATLLSDISWAFVFSPLLIFFAIAVLFVIATYFIAGSSYIQATSGDVSNRVGYQDNLDELNKKRRAAREAKIYFFDALIYTVLVALLVTFLVLLIVQLDSASTKWNWNIVFLPLYLLWFVLFFVFIGGALRVAAEERYQRPLGNADCCGATFGGVVFCCDSNTAQLAYADQEKLEKRAAYIAAAGYHELPWAFMCTPLMSYGWLDVLLGWLWLGWLIVLTIVTALLAKRLNSGTESPTLASIFIAPWIIEGLIILVALGLLISLLLCYRRVVQRPPGRSALLSKYAESFFLIITNVLLIIEQILLVQKIDDNNDSDWNVVFIPLYILIALYLLIGCCGVICGKPAAEDGSAVWNGSRRTPVYADASSDWGVMSAV